MNRAAMRVVAGQDWELPNANSDDPLVLRIYDVRDQWAHVRVVQRSKPDVILDRSTMHCRDVIDAGVLVAGPGATAAEARRNEIEYLRDLLLYAARRTGVAAGNDVRFDGEAIIESVKADLKVPRDHARALIRDALATLGGSETWRHAYWSNHDEAIYVIPASRLDSKQQAVPGRP